MELVGADRMSATHERFYVHFFSFFFFFIIVFLFQCEEVEELQKEVVIE